MFHHQKNGLYLSIKHENKTKIKIQIYLKKFLIDARQVK